MNTLNLQNIAIQEIHDEALVGLEKCKYLDIRYNHIRIITKNALNYMPVLVTLKSDHTRLCCLKHVDTCIPSLDEFASCDDLLANQQLRSIILSLGICSIVGNLIVMVSTFRTKSKDIYYVFNLNLSVSDFLMGVYLLIIITVDKMYRGIYIEFIEQWKSGKGCVLAGILHTLSTEMSLYMLSVITIDRLVVVFFPHLSAKKSNKQARIICMFGWVMMCFLATIPLAFEWENEAHFFGHKSVCVAFSLKDLEINRWRYCLVVFVIVNVPCLTTMFLGYIFLFKKSMETYAADNRASDEDLSLAYRMTLKVIAGFVCWLSVMTMMLMSYNGVLFSDQISSLVTMIILPCNSALNPLLSIIMSLQFKKKTVLERRVYIN